MKLQTVNGSRNLITGREICWVLLLSALAFFAFYFNAYFSPGFQGMLGYELRTAISQIQGYFNAVDRGSTLLWDPYYFQYTPRAPHAPIYSPVTIALVLTHRLVGLAEIGLLLLALLAILALIQISCAATMFVLLRYGGLGFLPAAFGGLVYAYNHQTFVHGIRHGPDRVSAWLLAPLFLLAFFKALEASSAQRRRLFAALSALFLGIAFISNGDVKPTVYFCIFMVVFALCRDTKVLRNLALLGIVFLLAAGVFMVQALPTVYALPYIERGIYSTYYQDMVGSIHPVSFLLTHVSTAFSRYYPWGLHWEHSVEFSLSAFMLVVLGFFALRRHPWRWAIIISLLVSAVWIMGRHTPLGPALWRLMTVFSLRNPSRMAALLYFCYAVLAGLGLERLLRGSRSPVSILALSCIPAGVILLYVFNPLAVPIRYLIWMIFSYLVILAISFGWAPRPTAWLLVVAFLLERTTIGVSLYESNPADTTEFYRYDEIYSTQARVRPILADPDYRDFRAYFKGEELPFAFSQQSYSGAFIDGIRPVFPMTLDEEMVTVAWLRDELQSARDWSNPIWDVFNVKYFVDLPVGAGSRLERLRRVDERLWVNPHAEREFFLRYRSELIENDEEFLERLKIRDYSPQTTVYINSADRRHLLPPADSMEGGEIRVVRRKPDEAVLEVNLPREAYIVFSEIWFFPWQAEINGRRTPLLRAYNALQAVRVEPGRHQVRFFFNSRHWRFVLPAAISGLTCLLLIAIVIVGHRRLRREGEPGVPDRS